MSSKELSVCKIQIISTEGIYEKYVEAVEFTLGRSAKHSDLNLPFKGISRKHLKVFIKDGTIYLQDLASKYGTFLNGTQLEAGKTVKYQPFDIIQFGKVPEVVIYMRPVLKAEWSHLESKDEFIHRFSKVKMSKVFSGLLSKEEDVASSEP
ncbi:MAG: FHA domain-containing protein [Bdellovibrio sp.]|nr:MAG: FHA domain-containing protein [Bdellovibrio sp.]